MSMRFDLLKSWTRETSRWLRRFARNERGVVAVEWVAIAGAALIGGIFVVWYLTNSLNTPASSIGGNLSDCETWASANSASITGCK
jgi:Flp pilus assembly pilin Flp